MMLEKRNSIKNITRLIVDFGKRPVFRVIIMVGIIVAAAVIWLSSSIPEEPSDKVDIYRSGIDTKQGITDQNTMDSISPNQMVVTEGDLINVVVDEENNDTRFSLHSIDFIDENTGWVVGDHYYSNPQGSQLLRTQDGGVHWEQIKLNDTTLNRLRFVDKTTGWAVAQDESKTTSGTQTYTMKILHTRDGGQSWDIQWENKVESPSECALWFQDAEYGLALVSGTLISTQDGGKQWTPVSFGLDNFTPQHMSFINADTGWLIGEIEQKSNSPSYDQNTETKLSVLQTTDGGRHWRQQFERTYSYGPIGSEDINFVNATTGWFLTSDFATMTGDLYYTSNAGQDWRKINQIRSARPSPTGLHFITPDLGWIPLEIGAGGTSGGLMLTHDGGKNFEFIDSFGKISSTSEVDFISQEQGWAIGNALTNGDYIIHTKDSGKTWTQVYPSIRPTEDISFVDNQHGFGLGQLSDSGALLYTTDGGDSWKNIYSFTKDCNPSMISFINRDTGWVLASSKDSANAVILKTSDGGNTWASSDGGISKIKSYFIDYFQFFDHDNGLLISKNADNMSFYRTQDGGRTWRLSGREASKDTQQFSFVSGKQGWEINLSDSGHMVDLNQMKDGTTWEFVGRIVSNARSYGMEFISEDKGWMLVEEPAFKSGSHKKLLTTVNGGQTWSLQSFPSGFELETIKNQIPMQFTDDRHGWILTRYGVLRTEDGGKTWTWK